MFIEVLPHKYLFFFIPIANLDIRIRKLIKNKSRAFVIRETKQHRHLTFVVEQMSNDGYVPTAPSSKQRAHTRTVSSTQQTYRLSSYWDEFGTNFLNISAFRLIAE